MEMTEETARVWTCTKCGNSELRAGPGPHFCVRCREHRDLFGSGTHKETCNGKMEEACLSTDTDVQNAEK